MNAPSTTADPQRLLVVLPNWVGDIVLATPVLAALRSRLPAAQITYLLRRYASAVLDGAGWHDDELHWPAGAGVRRELGWPRLVGQLRRGRFNAALLLPNSVRSALAVWLAGIPRRIGYARDGRGALLTEWLEPPRIRGEYVPTPILPYYARLGARLGARVSDSHLRLAIPPAQAEAGAQLQSHYGLQAGEYALINPGAAFGAAKCWRPEGFAEVCDQITARYGWLTACVGAPHESPLMHAIAQRARSRVIVCDQPGTTLGSLKVLVRDAAALICNDTGPRHYGHAFDTPTVTIFGPTFQEWTDTDWRGEVKLQARVPCGPCQLKRCPLDHRCMRLISADDVLQALERVLAGARRAATASLVTGEPV